DRCPAGVLGGGGRCSTRPLIGTAWSDRLSRNNRCEGAKFYHCAMRPRPGAQRTTPLATEHRVLSPLLHGATACKKYDRYVFAACALFLAGKVARDAQTVPRSGRTGSRFLARYCTCTNRINPCATTVSASTSLSAAAAAAAQAVARCLTSLCRCRTLCSLAAGTSTRPSLNAAPLAPRHSAATAGAISPPPLMGIRVINSRQQGMSTIPTSLLLPPPPPPRSRPPSHLGGGFVPPPPPAYPAPPRASPRPGPDAGRTISANQHQLVNQSQRIDAHAYWPSVQANHHLPLLPPMSMRCQCPPRWPDASGPDAAARHQPQQTSHVKKQDPNRASPPRDRSQQAPQDRRTAASSCARSASFELGRPPALTRIALAWHGQRVQYGFEFERRSQASRPCAWNGTILAAIARSRPAKTRIIEPVNASTMTGAGHSKDSGDECHRAHRCQTAVARSVVRVALPAAAGPRKKEKEVPRPPRSAAGSRVGRCRKAEGVRPPTLAKSGGRPDAPLSFTEIERASKKTMKNTWSVQKKGRGGPQALLEQFARRSVCTGAASPPGLASAAAPTATSWRARRRTFYSEEDPLPRGQVVVPGWSSAALVATDLLHGRGPLRQIRRTASSTPPACRRRESAAAPLFAADIVCFNRLGGIDIAGRRCRAACCPSCPVLACPTSPSVATPFCLRRLRLAFSDVSCRIAPSSRSPTSLPWGACRVPGCAVPRAPRRTWRPASTWTAIGADSVLLGPARWTCLPGAADSSGSSRHRWRPLLRQAGASRWSLGSQQTLPRCVRTVVSLPATRLLLPNGRERCLNAGLAISTLQTSVAVFHIEDLWRKDIAAVETAHDCGQANGHLVSSVSGTEFPVAHCTPPTVGQAGSPNLMTTLAWVLAHAPCWPSVLLLLAWLLVCSPCAGRDFCGRPGVYASGGYYYDDFGAIDLLCSTRRPAAGAASLGPRRRCPYDDDGVGGGDGTGGALAEAIWCACCQPPPGRPANDEAGGRRQPQPRCLASDPLSRVAADGGEPPTASASALLAPLLLSKRANPASRSLSGAQSRRDGRARCSRLDALFGGGGLCDGDTLSTSTRPCRQPAGPGCLHLPGRAPRRRSSRSSSSSSSSPSVAAPLESDGLFSDGTSVTLPDSGKHQHQQPAPASNRASVRAPPLANRPTVRTALRRCRGRRYLLISALLLLRHQAAARQLNHLTEGADGGSAAVAIRLRQLRHQRGSDRLPDGLRAAPQHRPGRTRRRWTPYERRRCGLALTPTDALARRESANARRLQGPPSAAGATSAVASSPSAAVTPTGFTAARSPGSWRHSASPPSCQRELQRRLLTRSNTGRLPPRFDGPGTDEVSQAPGAAGPIKIDADEDFRGHFRQQRRQSTARVSRRRGCLSTRSGHENRAHHLACCTAPPGAGLGDAPPPTCCGRAGPGASDWSAGSGRLVQKKLRCKRCATRSPQAPALAKVNPSSTGFGPTPSAATAVFNTYFFGHSSSTGCSTIRQAGHAWAILGQSARAGRARAGRSGRGARGWLTSTRLGRTTCTCCCFF
uniref:Protein kinase domain-containing protein n=1 Tax=Macrostomum lignano TaxID=282301 RepID=A0A1I8F5E3_9PLAT